MSPDDVALFIAQLVSAWAIGFAGGWIITIFKRAIDQTT